jgi:hypothetical protein
MDQTTAHGARRTLISRGINLGDHMLGQTVEFQLGQTVSFELGCLSDGTLDGLPRWISDIDRGSTGRWAQAEVVGVGDEIIEVHYTNPITGFDESWLFGIEPSNMDRPGWVRLVSARVECECGAERVYGKNAPHSAWCPMHGVV